MQCMGKFGEIPKSVTVGWVGIDDIKKAKERERKYQGIRVSKMERTWISPPFPKKDKPWKRLKEKKK